MGRTGKTYELTQKTWLLDKIVQKIGRNSPQEGPPRLKPGLFILMFSPEAIGDNKDVDGVARSQDYPNRKNLGNQVRTLKNTLTNKEIGSGPPTKPTTNGKIWSGPRRTS